LPNGLHKTSGTLICKSSIGGRSSNSFCTCFSFFAVFISLFFFLKININQKFIVSIHTRRLNVLSF